jgi:hypothetical protein
MWFSGRDTAAGNYTIGYAAFNLVTLSLGDTSGSGQSGAVGSALSQPFVVGLRDDCGNPVSGVSTTFVISGFPAGAAGQGLSVLASTPASQDRSPPHWRWGTNPASTRWRPRLLG